LEDFLSYCGVTSGEKRGRWKKNGGREMLKNDPLFDYIFNPRSVAIVGASPQDLATLAQVSTKIRDRLFLVNPKYSEVRGKKCYPILSAVEAEIEYAILIVSAGMILQVLEECVEKGEKVARFTPPASAKPGFPRGSIWRRS
jgi:predicted CoA-binding protein